MPHCWKSHVAAPIYFERVKADDASHNGIRHTLIVTQFEHAVVRLSNDFRVKHAFKVRKRAKTRNRYNQAPHLTQDTNGKVTTSKLDITNESQEVSPFPAGDHKASLNRCGLRCLLRQNRPSEKKKTFWKL